VHVVIITVFIPTHAHTSIYALKHWFALIQVPAEKPDDF
jgi:hypothetical protein